MSPVYLNPHQSSSIPFLDLKGDQHHNLPTMGGYEHDRVTNTSNNNSYFSGSNFGYPHVTTEFLAMDYSRCTQEKVVEKLILSHDHQPSVYPIDHIQGDHNTKIIRNNYENPKKCKPTKLKITQKAAAATEKWKKLTGDNKGNQAQESNNNIYRKTRNEANNHNNGIRMCSDCHTTATPLWRSGPQGPKSLCNACGIRQRKARKAAAAAAAAAMAASQAQASEAAMGGSGSSSPMSSSTTFEAPKATMDEEMSRSKVKLDNDHNIISSHTLPLKKRSKIFNNSSWSYNNNIDTNNDINCVINDNSTKRVFPSDEEEGAILLMSLSCGLGWSS